MPFKSFSLALLLALCLALLSVGDAFAAAKKRFIVVGGDIDTVKNHVHAEGGEVNHDLLFFHGFVSHMSDKAKERLKAKFGDDVIIEEDAIVTADATTTQTTPWGIKKIQARDANKYNSGSGAVVCVVDTGIQKDHPDLKLNIIGGENFVEENGVVSSSNWGDKKGHGTHVAGIIAARNNTYGVVGVAPLAKLFAARVLDANGSGYVSDFAEGIMSCLDHGADVINMSLSTKSSSTLLYNTIKYAYDQGAILVAAAGNSASSVAYPAKYSQVLAVSATTSSNTLASYSNYGPEIDFAAPGSSIYSTYMGSKYATMSGTSMAAPHVAGVAALWVSSGSAGLVGVDIGLSDYAQGDGLINALKTVLN